MAHALKTLIERPSAEGLLSMLHKTANVEGLSALPLVVAERGSKSLYKCTGKRYFLILLPASGQVMLNANAVAPDTDAVASIE